MYGSGKNKPHLVDFSLEVITSQDLLLTLGLNLSYNRFTYNN